MRRSIKNAQRAVRMIALNVDGTGTAALAGLDKFQATLTDNGVGDYTITFDEAFAAADFSVAVTPLTEGIIAQIHTKAVGSVRIKTFAESTAAGAVVAAVKASGILNMPTDDITVIADAFGDEANGIKVTIDVEAAAANAGNKVLVDFLGEARDIHIRITPDDGGQNVTVTELVSIINGGTVGTATVTDVNNLLSLINATGSGNTDVFANGGIGDGVTVALAGGSDVNSTAAGVARAAADCDFDLVIIGADVVDRY